MDSALISPAKTMILGMPAAVVYTAIPVIGIALFGYMIYNRLKPLIKAAPDHRSNALSERTAQLLKIWLLQARHPRYMAAGIQFIQSAASRRILPSPVLVRAMTS